MEDTAILFLNNKKNSKIKNKKEKIYKNKRKVFCIEDNLLFNSMTDCAKFYGIKPSSIHNLIKGLSKKLRINKTIVYV